MAFLAKSLESFSPSLKPSFLASSKAALLFNPVASLPPALAPRAKPETANGAIKQETVKRAQSAPAPKAVK